MAIFFSTKNILIYGPVYKNHLQSRGGLYQYWWQHTSSEALFKTTIWYSSPLIFFLIITRLHSILGGPFSKMFPFALSEMTSKPTTQCCCSSSRSRSRSHSRLAISLKELSIPWIPPSLPNICILAWLQQIWRAGPYPLALIYTRIYISS